MVAMILLQHVSTVRDRRAAHLEKAAELKRLTEAFMLSVKPLAAEVKARAAQVELAEAELKGAALAHFTIHHDKKPCPGVEIKDFDVVEYDASTAFAWAKTAGVAVIPEQLDTKAFAKIAAASSLPFVTKKKEPQAQIATDIDKALAVAQATDPSIAEALASAPTLAGQPVATEPVKEPVKEPAREMVIADAPLPWDDE